MGAVNTDSSESGERSGFTEPTTKEIFRDSTLEDRMADRDAKQRHITDVAKKLDKDMTIMWVEKGSDKLGGKNGKYVRSTNTMYLAKDMTVVEMYVEVFKHEFVHRLESRKAYIAFKDYLVNRSTAFENYARGQLNISNGEVFDGTRQEVIKAISEQYYNRFVNDRTIAKPTRDKFTMEDAEREVVADFVGEVLFKGKENRLKIAQALSEEGNADKFKEIGNIESSVDFFTEIARDNRNLLQKFIDVIKDFIANLKGLKQNERLVNDLGYIEERLARVYASKDTKKTADNSGEKYSSNKKNETNSYNAYNEPITVEDSLVLHSIGRKSVNQFTDEDIKKSQKWAYKFYQQLGEKSPFFRAWFGDWRAYDRGMANIICTKGPMRSSSIKNTDTNWDIIVSKQVAKETNHHSGNNEINAVKYLPYIVDITQNAVLFDTEVSNKDNPLSVMFHSLYAYTEVMGYPALLKLQVEELVNEKDGSPIYRDYILQNIEEEPISLGKRFSKAHHHETDSSSISISDLFNLVKQYDESFKPNPVNKMFLNKDGTPKKFYHGSKKGGGFTVFKGWQYFTESKEYAERYMERDNPESLYEGYIKMQKPFDTRNPECKKIFEQMRSEYGLSELQENGLPDWTDGYDIADFIEENNLDFDGIILDEGGDIVDGKPVSRGLSYVVRDSRQIKSATDNIGTFNENEGDIRYSSGSPMQQARENLTRYENGEISREEYLEENDRLWGDANEKFGIIEQGENSQTPTPIAVPKAVADDKPTELLVMGFERFYFKLQ